MAKKALVQKQQRTPKFKVRGYTRCRRCGRARSVYKRFGLCRICFRIMAHAGEVPGTTYDTWSTPHGTVGVAICKDLDFPPLGREYGNRGVGLLFVPAWDFNVDGWYHSRMAIMRGVESGFSIARVAKQGLHTVS